MADTLDSDHDASFWLPTDFLADDDDDHHRKLPRSRQDDELLAELTRHDTRYNPTEKQPWLFSTSPQSTLSGFGPWSNRSGFSSNGSPNGPSRVPSPPVTPPGGKSDAAWDLLYEAAEQVARLKINALAAAQLNHIQQNRGGFLESRRNPNPTIPAKSTGFYDFPNTNQFEAAKRHGGTMWAQGRQEAEAFHCPHHHHHHHHPRRSSDVDGATLGLPQSAWPALDGKVHRHQPLHRKPRQHGGPLPESGMRAMFLGGDTGIKRQSAGTGVFLPRRPGTQPPPPAETRRKPTGGSPVLIPARVAQALNLNLDEINTSCNLNAPARFGRGLLIDHELLRSRRNLFLEQQRRSGGSSMAVNHGVGVSLPTDWTY